MRFERTVSEELSYPAIYNLNSVSYEIALIIIERLTDSVIYNFKMTDDGILDES